MRVIAVKGFLTHDCVMSANDPHFRLRLPAELKATVEKLAKETNRSINSVIVEALQDQFSEDGRVARLQASVANAIATHKNALTGYRFIAAAFLSAVEFGKRLSPADLDALFGPNSNIGKLIHAYTEDWSRDGEPGVLERSKLEQAQKDFMAAYKLK